MARIPRRLVRGTNAEVAAYTGPTGEPVYNVDTKRLHMQDAVTAGGVPMARLDDGPAESVLRFGSTANNGVVDARVAIAAALAAGIKNLYFPPGTYLFPNKLANVVSASGLRFHGVRGSTIFKSSVPAAAPATGDAVFFLFSSCTGIQIEGITFDLDSILTVNHNTAAVGFLDCDGVHVDKCDVLNGKRLGISANGSNRLAVTNCRLHRSGPPVGTYQNEAILNSVAFAPSSSIYVANNDAEGWGLLLSGRQVVVVGNRISGFGYGGGVTIEGDAETVAPIIIGNEVFGSVGIDVNDTRPLGIECWAQGAIIHGNRCYDNAGAGIAFAGAFSSVKGNICYNNGTYDNTGIGIFMQYQPGIQVCTGAIVEGNICFDSGAGRQQYGYCEHQNVSATFTNNLISNNNCYDNTVANYLLTTVGSNNSWVGKTREGLATVTRTVNANSTATSDTITVGNAQPGDFVEISCSAPLSGCIATGYVQTAGTVYLTITNPTGSNATFTSAVFRARVSEKRP